MNTDRRDFLAGMACLAALGGAEWLRPREPLILMPQGVKLAAIVPQQIAPWQRGGDGDVVVPRTEGSLASQLYGDQLARIYIRGDQPGLPMMLSIAYGVRQSDALQLHRPEACYPAIGFRVGPSHRVNLAAPGGAVAAVSLTASLPERIEDIVYWTRVGRRFPATAAEQREMRLADAVAGLVPDGALVRASAVRTDQAIPVFAAVTGFLETMIAALDAAGRQALLGRA